MKTHTKVVLFLIGLMVSMLAGCIKEDQYPIIPHIEYNGFSTFRDVTDKDSSGRISFSYTDGDGNLGLEQWDSVGPYKYNFYLRFMQYVNGELIDVPTADPSGNFNARIPNLTPSGPNKNIRGNISMDLDLYYVLPNLQSDTIAFSFYLKDRDLNESNVIETPLYIIKK